PNGLDFPVFGMLKHQADSNDPYLPLMYWYAIAAVIHDQPFPAPGVLEHCNVPIVRQFVSRRRTEIGNKGKSNDFNSFEAFFAYLGDKGDPVWQRDMLRGITEGFGGRRQVAMPSSWKKTYTTLIESPLPEVRERALALAVQFGDERAFTLLRKIVPDRIQPVKERESALKTLLFQQKADLVPMLHHLLDDGDLRSQAIRGLAAFDDPLTPMLLLKNYPKWSTDEKSDVIQTLSARPKYALALLD